MAHLLRGMAHLLALLARHAQRAPEETGESEGGCLLTQTRSLSS